MPIFIMLTMGTKRVRQKWKWYNKVDTKIREKCERVICFMRKSYDKQFKIAAVKLVLEDEMPVADAAEAYLSITILYTVG